VEMNNRARLAMALEHLSAGLAPLVDERLRNHIGEDWNTLWALAEANFHRKVRPEWSHENAANWAQLPPPERRAFPRSKHDPQYLLKAIGTFSASFDPSAAPALPLSDAKSVLKARNDWAHEFESPLSDERTARAFDAIERLLHDIGADTLVQEVQQLRAASPRWDSSDVWTSIEQQSFAEQKFASSLEDREVEVASLGSFCTKGEEQRLLVVGERYSGKSALLAELFVDVDPSEALVLGYFVPHNQPRYARSDEMVRRLVRQVYLLLQGRELHSDSTNPARLRELLVELVASADARQRTVAVIIDGIDEDQSAEYGQETMISVLDGLAVPGLKIMVSSIQSRANTLAPGWPVFRVERNDKVSADLEQVTTEILDLFGEDLSRSILQFLTFGRGTFEIDDLRQLIPGSDRRQLRRILSESKERTFHAVATDSVERWGFAHEAYAKVARDLFEQIPWPAGELTTGMLWPETVVARELERWTMSFRNQDWPRSTPLYLLTDYPGVLASSDLPSLLALLAEPAYLRAITSRLGLDNQIPVLAQLAIGHTTADFLSDAPVLRGDHLRHMVMLASLRDVYRRTNERVPPVLLEAIGTVRGAEAADSLALDLLSDAPAGGVDWDFPPVREAGHGIAPKGRSAVIRAMVRANAQDELLAGIGGTTGIYIAQERVRAKLLQGDNEKARDLLAEWEHRLADQDDDRTRVIGYSTLAMLYFDANDPSAAARCAAHASNTLNAMLAHTDLVLEEDAVRGFRLHVSIALVWGGAIDDAIALMVTADEALPDRRAWTADPPSFGRDLTVDALKIPPEETLETGLTGNDPVIDFARAMVATGHDALAAEYLSARLRSDEHPALQFVRLIAAGMTEQAFALIERLRVAPEDLEVDPDLDPSHGVVRWQLFLLGLIARFDPRPAEVSRALAAIRTHIASSTPYYRPLLARYLCWALASAGAVDELEGLLQDLPNRDEAMIWAVDASARVGDPDGIARFALRDDWFSARAQTGALAALAVAWHRFGDGDAAEESLQHAISLAAGPRTASDPVRQNTLRAACGAEVEWGWLIAQATETSLTGLASAAMVAREPARHLTALEQAAKSLDLLERVSALSPILWIVNSDVFAGPDPGLLVRAADIVKVGKHSETWHQAHLRLAEAIARAGSLAQAKPAAQKSQESLLSWYDRGQGPGLFPSDSLELGEHLLRTFLLGILPNPASGEVFSSFANDYVAAACDGDDLGGQGSLPHAVVRGLNSLLLLTAGERAAARDCAMEAATSLIDTDPSDQPGSDARDAALVACVATLASSSEQSDIDHAARLMLDHVRSPGMRVRAARHLRGSDTEESGFAVLEALTLAVLPRTPWIDAIESLDVIDPGIVQSVARFELSLT
jgi:hypothetical protein